MYMLKFSLYLITFYKKKMGYVDVVYDTIEDSWKPWFDLMFLFVLLPMNHDNPLL